MSPHNKQTTELDQSETRKGLLTPLYFQCPNELVDYWLPRLNLVELRVFLFINRKTLGWHKIKDRISLSQIQEATGSQKIHILKAIDALMQKGLISKEVIGENGVQHTFYSLLFVDSNNSYQCQKDTPPSVKKTPPPSVKKTPTKDTVTKDTLTKEKQQQRPKRKKSPSAPVVVFSCLSEIDIPLADKRWFSKRYTEAEVLHALEFHRQQPEITSTLQQKLKWICRENPIASPSAESKIEDRKKEVREIETYLEHSEKLSQLQGHIYVGPESVVYGAGQAQFVIKYLDKEWSKKIFLMKRYFMI